MGLIRQIRTSLRFKLIVTTTLIAGSMLALLFGNTLRIVKQNAEKQAALRIESINITLNQALAPDIFQRHYSDANAKIIELVEKSSETFVYLAVLDEHGKVFARAGNIDSPVRPEADSARRASSEVYDAIAPLTIESLRVGEVRYGLSLAAMTAMRNGILWQNAIISVVALAVLILAISLMSHWLTRDIRHLADKAESLAQNRYGGSIMISSRDEVGILAQSFNRMTEAIHSQLVALRRYEGIVHSSDDAIISTTLDGVVASWNPAAERMFGHGASEMIGNDMRILLPAGKVTEYTDVLVRIMRGETVVHFETSRQKKDGSQIDVSASLSPIHNEHGLVVGISEITRDITDRKYAEEALRTLNRELERRVTDRTADLEAAKNDAERANRYKSEFLSHMSHELRTPMNAILGFAQVLEMEKINPGQLEFVREIHRAGDHLLELINELLDLSRIEAGKMATVVQAVNVREVAVDALQISQPLIRSRQINVLNRCEARIMVLADPTRLKQILVNLLSNAAKYNRDGGRILIDCRHKGPDQVRISIKDTGQGIAPEKLASLYKPFERLGAENSTIDGTGIGLALSKQLAELMGGVLGVDTTLGEGSTFWIDLPSTPESADAESPAVPAGAGPLDNAHLPSVLYVEDNAANLRVVEAMFRRQPQFRLLSATNGEFGLELAKRYIPDIILLDIHLPGMDGYAVLDALRADDAMRNIPVIALSADAMPIDIERGLKAGFRRYLTKPVKVEALIEAITACLKQAVTSPKH